LTGRWRGPWGKAKEKMNSQERLAIVVLKTLAVCSEQVLRYSAEEGGPMRKVVAMELVSLDGVLAGHGGVPGL
jgi:hypothetical protein